MRDLACVESAVKPNQPGTAAHTKATPLPFFFLLFYITQCAEERQMFSPQLSAASIRFIYSQVRVSLEAARVQAAWTKWPLHSLQLQRLYRELRDASYAHADWL